MRFAVTVIAVAGVFVPVRLVAPLARPADERGVAVAAFDEPCVTVAGLP